MKVRSLFCAALISAASFYMPAFSSIGQDQSLTMIKEEEPTGTLELRDMKAPEVKEIVLTDAIASAQILKQPVVVVVEKSRHITHVLQSQNGEVVEVFRAANATGAMRTPTPEGRVKVISRQLDPIWSPPPSIDPRQRKVASFSKNKHNPLGVAWLGLSKWSIGLHGTNAPSSIGRNASHGCVRHKNVDAKALFNIVPVGSPVYIVGNFAGTRINAEDAKHLFGMSEVLAEHYDTTDDAQFASVRMASLSNL